MLDRFNQFNGKRILLTGHTGFKGTWLSIWLHQLGAEVIGYSLDPESQPNLFELTEIGEDITDYRADIRDKDKLFEVFEQEQPDYVFHLAAQALVIEGYKDPLDTFETNTIGTANVLEAIRKTPSVKAAVIVTTDKVYENREWSWSYRENDHLGGHDPYSASKSAADIIASSYLRSFFSQEKDGRSIGMAIVRAGNVIGGGDWSEHRIVPDFVKALTAGDTLLLRNPGSTRPWQHVLEPLGGYLLLATRLIQDPTKFSGAWNFGPGYENIVTVETLAQIMIKHMGKGDYSIDETYQGPKESKSLSLDISKARFELGWSPKLDFDQTAQWTLDWYEKNESSNARSLCEEQINAYSAL